MILVDEIPALQRMLQNFENHTQKYGIKINVKKMNMRVNDGENMRASILEGWIGQMEKYRYWGTIVTKEWNVKKEIRQRITVTKENFNTKKRLLCGKSILDTDKFGKEQK